MPELAVSVDTYRPAVVEAVLGAGAALVNDVSGLLHPEVADLCGAAGAGLVVMHTRARPKHKVLDPDLYDDVTGDVVGFLRGRIDGLLDDPKLPDRLSEDEREYRGSQLATGVLTMYVVGSILLLAALGLYLWGV